MKSEFVISKIIMKDFRENEKCCGILTSVKIVRLELSNSEIEVPSVYCVRCKNYFVNAKTGNDIEDLIHPYKFFVCKVKTYRARAFLFIEKENTLEPFIWPSTYGEETKGH